MRTTSAVIFSFLIMACGGDDSSSNRDGGIDGGGNFDARPPLPDAALPACSPQSASVDELRLEEVASGLTNNLTYLSSPPGDRRLFVTEQPGRIRIVDEGTLQTEPYLDIFMRVESGGNEQGLLGLAFHPSFADNGLYYVNYTAENPDYNPAEQDGCSPTGSPWMTVVSEFRVPDPRAQTTDAATERILITVPQFQVNHNGGMIAFGPDDMLYIAIGDGGGSGDPCQTGQDMSNLLGKVLRIDVSGTPYTVPSDNPFVSTGNGVRPEIWAYGLRNPWRISFDRMTGDLYIADVGQNQVEEVNAVAASSTGGENYGWRIAEGNECFNPQSFESPLPSCDRTGFTEPILTYDHPTGFSITGGFVYRGTCLQGIEGTYFYSDAAIGNFFRTLQWSSGGGLGATNVLDNLGQGSNLAAITSFGEDSTGEMYVVSRNGRIFRIVKPSE